MLDEILIARLHPGPARASAALLAVGGGGRTLQITAGAARDRHLLVGNKIFELEFCGFVFDYGAALVTIELLDFFQLSDDDVTQLFLGAKDRFEFRDALA